MEETWKDIVGYEGIYQISNLGNIKSLDREVICKNGTVLYVKGKFKNKINHNRGYLMVALYKNNKSKNLYIHRLVAEAFIPNNDNKKTVNHIDGNKHNNNVENLEWATYTENNHHAFKTGLNKLNGSSKGLIVYYRDGKIEKYKSTVEFSRYLKCHRDTICKYLSGGYSSLLDSLGITNIIQLNYNESA